VINRSPAALSVPTLGQILAFCAEDPVERVLLEDIARRGLGRFAAVHDDGALTALCHVGANIVPAGERCGVFADHARNGRSRMIIGEERAVGDLWEAMRDRMPQPREDRPGQPVYAIDEAPEPGDTGLRPATPADFDLLLPACAAAHEVEIGTNPLAQDASGFRWRTRSQIEEGRSWIWRDGSTIRFKAEASAWTPSAVQIQQVWVDPAARGRGFAQRAMRDLCRLLLKRAARVTLFVRPENAPAIRVYEAVGMRQVLAFRSVIL
jgi:RimJ/RimL family protein N-acetyltransferase